MGAAKGGVAIYVHETAPYYDEYSAVAQEKNAIEHCAVTTFPNHNPKGRLLEVGVHRPPEKMHSPYAAAPEKWRRQKRSEYNDNCIRRLQQTRMGTTEKGEYQAWREKEPLRELPNPEAPTYRPGTTTDGVLSAPGHYMPEEILPRDLDREWVGSSSMPIPRRRRKRGN